MSKYGKEVILGVAPVILVFLLFLKVDIIPFVFLLAIGAGIFYIVKIRGTITGGVNIKGEKQQKKPDYLTFDDIGGQEMAKKEFIEALDFIVKYKDIQRLGIRPLKGVLLTGPPGTGKTLLAKAAAHYTQSAFVSASGSEFVEMYVGVGASRVRDLFKEAKQKAHKENRESAIVFIDEIDVIGGKRDGGQQKEYDQTLNQLLTEMDGIHTSEMPRILVVAATNRKDTLDSALLRPGRFDRHIQVDLPDVKGRLHILNIHAHNKPIKEDVDLQRVADETFGFSGAQLESVMNEAAIYAMRDEQSEIEQKHLSMAIDKVMLGEKIDRKTTEEERKRVAIHELGHAIAAEAVRPGSVSQVALSPRGKALGYVRHHPQEERYMYTKPFIEQQIMIALAGAVAEEMFYGGRSTGSRNDFEQAVQLVRTMMESGLTDLGIIDTRMVTKEQLMSENKRILDELTERTRQLLDQYRSIFERALDILLKEENLSGEQFRALMSDDKYETPA